MNFSWNDLAFGDKKPLNQLKATFIVAPRTISQARFKALIKQYLPQGNIALGIANEDYVLGFEDQPQFKTLRLPEVESIIAKVNELSPNKVATITYDQTDLKYLFQKLKFKRVVLVNGSWQYAFHTQPAFYELHQKGTPFEYASAFVDEAEAIAYAKNVTLTAAVPSKGQVLSTANMVAVTKEAAKRSYDYNNQVGACIGKPKGNDNYEFLAASHNAVVPYETFALLNGASRERNFSPPNDLNHYDTVHAEVNLIIQATEQPELLNGNSLFVNVLPCPACSRMIAQTKIKEVVYSQDHSNGYAIALLKAAGKTVKRVVTEDVLGANK